MGCKSMLILADICELAMGKVQTIDLTLYNYISTENMLQNKAGIIKSSGLPNTLQTQAFKNGDVLVSNIRPYFKKIWLANKDGGCSNDVLVFRTNKNVIPELLYYILSNDNFFDYSTKTAKGTKMPRGDKKAIMQYKVPNIDIEQQKAIVAVLKKLDDKIELNNKINDNLEQQAQAIYNDMFANNDKNSILSDIANITMGQSPVGSSYNETGDGIVFYQGRAEFSRRFPKRRLFTTEPKRMAEENDILMSVRAPVGDINIAHERCCIGRGLSSIHSKTGHNSFLLYTMFSSEKELDVYNGEGTVFGSINREALNKLPIFLPSSNLVQTFEDIVSAMDNIIRVNSDEVERLTQLRDTLLPRLMSSEIDVSQIEI